MCVPSGAGGGGGSTGFSDFRDAQGNKVGPDGKPLTTAALPAYVAPTPVDPAVIAARQNLIMRTQMAAPSGGGTAPTGG